jgi:hypothetical protein
VEYFRGDTALQRVSTFRRSTTPVRLAAMDVRHNITEIFVHSHFFLRKIHYWQGTLHLHLIYYIFFLLSFDDCEEKRFYSPDSVPPALANKHTTFVLAHAQGRVLADGVTFRHGEPNGGGWFWWWNWRAFACMLLALGLVGVGTLGTMVRDSRGSNCTRCCSCLLLCSLSLTHSHVHRSILTTHSPVQKNQQYVSKESLWIPGNAPILADMHKYERYDVVHAPSSCVA